MTDIYTEYEAELAAALEADKGTAAGHPKEWAYPQNRRARAARIRKAQEEVSKRCDIGPNGFCYAHQVWTQDPTVGRGRFTLSPCNPSPVTVEWRG